MCLKLRDRTTSDVPCLSCVVLFGTYLLADQMLPYSFSGFEPRTYVFTLLIMVFTNLVFDCAL